MIASSDYYLGYMKVGLESTTVNDSDSITAIIQSMTEDRKRNMLQLSQSTVGFFIVLMYFRLIERLTEEH